MALWEHPNTLTWEKREKSKVLASVTVFRDGSAMAMAVVNGQKERRICTDDLAAKAWCDTMLESTETVQEAPPPNVPMQDEVLGRLIRFLHNDPDLAWVIANQAKALGPWVSVGDDRRDRSDCTGFVFATVQFQEHGWMWAEFTPMSGPSRIIAEQDDFATDEAAKRSCDAHLRSKGWLLATKPVRTP